MVFIYFHKDLPLSLIEQVLEWCYRNTKVKWKRSVSKSWTV